MESVLGQKANVVNSPCGSFFSLITLFITSCSLNKQHTTEAKIPRDGGGDDEEDSDGGGVDNDDDHDADGGGDDADCDGGGGGGDGEDEGCYLLSTCYVPGFTSISL